MWSLYFWQYENVKLTITTEKVLIKINFNWKIDFEHFILSSNDKRKTVRLFVKLSVAHKSQSHKNEKKNNARQKLAQMVELPQNEFNVCDVLGTILLSHIEKEWQS